MTARLASICVLATLVVACAPPVERPTTPPDAQPAPDATETAAAPEPPAVVVSGPFATSVRQTLTLPTTLAYVGLSPDGSHLLVEGPHDEGRRCDGGPKVALQVYELPAGELRPALDPNLGVTLVLPRADGSVVLLDSCEGFVESAWTAGRAADGSFTNVTPLPLPGVPEDPDDDSGPAVTAVQPGPGDLITIARFTIEGAELLAIDDSGTVVTEPRVLDRELYAVAPTAVSTFYVEHGTQPAVVDVETGERYEGFQEVVEVAGVGTVLAGDAGISVLSGPDESPQVWAADPVDDGVQWSLPTGFRGDRLLAVEDAFGAARLVLLGPEGIIDAIDTDVGTNRAASVSADGTRVAYTRVDPLTFDRTLVLVDVR